MISSSTDGRDIPSSASKVGGIVLQLVVPMVPPSLRRPKPHHFIKAFSIVHRVSLDHRPVLIYPSWWWLESFRCDGRFKTAIRPLANLIMEISLWA